MPVKPVDYIFAVMETNNEEYFLRNNSGSSISSNPV